MSLESDRSLEEQRLEFSQSPLLAMPIAGTIMWAIIGIASVFLPIGLSAWILFICTGMIFLLGLFIARFTGEDLMGNARKNEFDRLFFYAILMSWLVFAIAIPFFMTDPTSLPLSVGILAGLMWLPLSWIIQHWVGMFHAFTRTALVLIAWFAFPDQRFTIIPAIIVIIYLITIYVLASRQRPQKEDVSRYDKAQAPRS